MPMTEEERKAAMRLMQMNPQLTPEQALAAVRRMPEGERVVEGTRGVEPMQQGPAIGTVAGDRPQVTTGLLGQGGMQPQQQQQRQPGGMSAGQCSAMGGVMRGDMCIIKVTH